MAVVQVKGVNVTKFESPGDSNWIDQGLIKSGIKVWSDTYESLGTETQASTIHLATLPVGAIVHFIALAYADVGAATSTLDVGDAVDPNRYASAIDTTAVGYYIGNLEAGAQHEIIATTTDIIATINVAAFDTTGTLNFSVYYSN